MTSREIADLLEPFEAVALDLEGRSGTVETPPEWFTERAQKLRDAWLVVVDELHKATDDLNRMRGAANDWQFRAERAEATLAKYGLAPGQLPTMDQVRTLGALAVDLERSSNIEQFTAEQRERYAAASKPHLEEELLRRDLNALNQGRQLTDGRVASRLLRELMRGMLQLADAAELKALESGLRTNPKGMTVDRILGLLGAEPADRRLLAESGTALGKGRTEEELRLDFEKPEGPTVDASTPQARPDVAESIRERRKRQVPAAPELATPADADNADDTDNTLPSLGD